MTLQQPGARLRPFRPTPFGRYTLLLPISTGGMGEIFLARLEGPRGFEKLCVIKKILPHLARDPEFVERFTNEAKTVVKLSHGSIAQVLDMGTQEGEPFIALEHVDGKDLRKVVARMRDRNMPIPLTFILYVMSRVLDALAYAHRKRDEEEKEIGLVHRDVSPQNILVSYEGEVKVIDFGLAKSTLNAAKTNPSIILGKFLYMSPEQSRHQRVDRRSDLYSVGLCLYELVCGRNPFEGVPPGELMARVASPSIPSLHTVEPLCPGDVEAIVMKALSVDPSQRFQSAEEFRGKLLGCLMEIDPAAGPESVSRFMRETFAAEFQQERRLLASLRDSLRIAAAAQANVRQDAETAVFALREVAPRTPSTEAAGRKAIEPSPLSFAPTPRTKEGSPQVDGETLPSIMVDDATLRPRAGAPLTGKKELNWSPPTDTAAKTPIGEEWSPPGTPDQTIEEPATETHAPISDPGMPLVSGEAVSRVLLQDIAATRSDDELVMGELIDGTTAPALPSPEGRVRPLQSRPRPGPLELSEPPELVETTTTYRARTPRWLWALLAAVTLLVGGFIFFDLHRRSVLGGRQEPAQDTRRNPSPTAPAPAREEAPEPKEAEASGTPQEALEEALPEPAAKPSPESLAKPATEPAVEMELVQPLPPAEKPKPPPKKGKLRRKREL